MEIPIGTRFGRFTVIGPGEKDPRTRLTYFRCRCDCGQEKRINGSHLKRGTSRSCGCISKEQLAAIATRHGESSTRLYGIWHSMKARCYNPKNVKYRRYGRRGIRVCDTWHTYVPFRDWALSHGYSEALTLERLDSNGDYEPENCTWADQITQARNRCNRVLIKAWGERKIFTEWLEDARCQVGYETLRARLKRGWSTERAIGTPPRKRSNPLQ